MRISYIGQKGGTSLHRLRALERQGHKVTLIDPWAWFNKNRWTGLWQYKLGAVGSNTLFGKRLLQMLQKTSPELIWVDQGGWIGRG